VRFANEVFSYLQYINFKKIVSNGWKKLRSMWKSLIEQYKAAQRYLHDIQAVKLYLGGDHNM